MTPVVIAVSACSEHKFSKPIMPAITLIAGFGIEGDAHAGRTVKHRSRVAKDPTQPNLRQVHILHAELLDELSKQGFSVGPGDIGDNIVTRGIDLLGLSSGTHLTFPSGAKIEITGLRNPCKQLDGLQKGLLKAVLDKDDDGNLIRKSGVMGIVLEGGRIKPDDTIEVTSPEGSHVSLVCV